MERLHKVIRLKEPEIHTIERLLAELKADNASTSFSSVTRSFWAALERAAKRTGSAVTAYHELVGRRR